jgi:uncharacterized protein involved in exopolysaccharide biosynthesis
LKDTDLEKDVAPSGQEEIDLLEVALDIWRSRKLVALGTALATIVVLLYVLLAAPVYRAEALIAPKESQKSGGTAAVLSQFGGFGGMVATQLGLGNTNLDRIEIIAKGRELAESVIQSNNFMPLLFPKDWDKNKQEWRATDTAEIPKLRQGIELLRKRYLDVSINKKSNTMIVGINAYDPILAEKIASSYVAALNDKVRGDVIRDAEGNREYLEKNAETTTDPLVHDKIQNMISAEIERMMLVNSQSFDVLEKPVVPQKPERPKKKLILAFSFFSGLLLIVCFVIAKKYWMEFKTKRALP